MEDGNYVAMEYINGKPLYIIFLSKLILRSYCSLGKICYELGKNLYFFHSRTIDNHKPVTLKFVFSQIDNKLKISGLFNLEEKARIRGHLANGVRKLGEKYELNITKSYNDWTIRNFLIDKNNALKLVDNDAMIHPGFPEYV